MLEHSSRNSADGSRVHQKAIVNALGDHRTFEAYSIMIGSDKNKTFNSVEVGTKVTRPIHLSEIAKEHIYF